MEEWHEIEAIGVRQQRRTFHIPFLIFRNARVVPSFPFKNAFQISKIDVIVSVSKAHQGISMHEKANHPDARIC